MALLPHEIVETSQDVKAVVIWLHGLGANGHDFVSIVPHLKLPKDLGVRFIFPHAPHIPITINGGMSMPGWYDILSINMEREIDVDQIHQSAQCVVDFIEDEIAKGIPSEKIVLAGFSQGGAVVYEAALSCSKKLAGLMTMSTYIATKDSIKLSAANANIPILITHGTQDPMVSEVMGQQAVEFLKGLNYQPVYLTYPMQHEVCIEQIEDLAKFLKSVLM